MSKKPDPRLVIYLQDSLHILQANLNLSHGAEPSCYRVVAGQLRLLLCDTTRQHGKIVDISLAARVFPHLLLPPLDPSGNPSQDSGTYRLTRPDWLAQELILPAGEMLSVHSIIRLACDHDGGAHVDLPPGPLPDVRMAVLAIAGAALPALQAAIAHHPE